MKFASISLSTFFVSCGKTYTRLRNSARPKQYENLAKSKKFYLNVTGFYYSRKLERVFEVFFRQIWQI